MAALLILLLLIVLIPAGLHFRSSPPSFHELLTNAAKAPSRWPLTAFAAIAGTALAIARICGGAEGEFYGRLLALLVFNIPLSYALAFFAVRLGFSRWCTQGWTLALCAGASFWIYSALPAVFAALIMLIGIAAVLLALAAQPPYREHNNLRYLSECHHLQCIFAVSGLSSTLLAVGVCTILLSISYLFDLRIGGEPYGVVWAVCLIFITTAVFLGLAATSPGEQHAEFIPGPLSGIKDYVVVPLLLVYTLILYIYGAVIGATLTLPKGLIGWMVSSYALLGLFVWLASYPPEAHRTASVKFFYRRFFLLLAPLLLLLAAGLWTRINQYGVTEERYYLALFALWLACASACFLRRAEMSLRFLPASLLVLILISCAGPWSAFSVSRQSQLKRWAKHLEEAGVMPPAFAKPQNKSPLQPQRELSRICEYLSAIYGKHVFRQFFKENTEVLRAIEQASDPLRYDFLSEFRRADFCEALLPALGLRYVQPYEGQSKSLNLNV
ncbi:MAG TPA: DUF4153 domain-containing protein, partial [Oligoflexia bacterium]|nr:DUF4153 domain-containing protein [Oligoflexia bacterium]